MKRYILATVAGLILAVHQPGYGNEIALPEMGVTGSTRLTPEEERHLGESFMRQVRQNLAIADDPEIEEYIWNLGYRLVANSDYKSQPFSFFVVKDPAINAFAGPAGYIGINSGLIHASESESELAAVMAHEIAHVAQHHLDRTLDAAEKLSLPTAGALIAAIILGAKDPNLAEAAIAATLAANAQTQINFTRGHEMEADHIGMQILAKSGFDPRAMPAFFERLQQTDRLYDNELPEFLRTHPVTTDRIAESRSRADKYPTPPHRDEGMYYLMQAKLRVLTADNPGQLARDFANQLKEGRYSDKRAVRYGYGLALAATGNYGKARQEIKIAIKEDGERIPYLIALAKIEIAAGENEAALHVLADALRLSPSNTPLTRHYASALIQSGDPLKARNVLEEYIKNTPPTPAAYELLAKADGNAGFSGAAHRALAEYYYLKGETHTAIEQLQLALQQKDITDREADLIEARIDTLKSVAEDEKVMYGDR